jgi:hypothetical protein
VPDYQFESQAISVPGDEMKIYFDKVLPYIGFLSGEQKDFIDYRSTKIVENKNYAVSVKFDEQLEKYVTLNFKTPYQNLHRVLFEFREIHEEDTVNYRKRFDFKNLKQANMLRKFLRT